MANKKKVNKLIKTKKKQASTQDRKSGDKPRQSSVGAPRNMEAHDKLLFVIDVILNDLECTRDMFNIVVPILKTHDDERHQDIEKTVKNLNREIKGKGPAPDKIIRHARKLLEFVKKIHRADVLFRSHALVCMVSQFDSFIAGLLKNALLAHPDRIITPDKKLNYDEIVAAGNIDNILEAFISKEIDELLRGPHDKQIDYLDKEFKLGIKENMIHYNTFIELTERRNLYAHNDGKVNKLYLRKCKNIGLDTNEEEGTYLKVEDHYFLNSFQCLYELAVKIGYSLAARLYTDKIKEIHGKVLETVGFPLLLTKDWVLAKHIFEFLLSWPDKYIPNDEIRRLYVINTCIAMKELGDNKGAESFLNKYDWTSQSAKYQLAVAILREKWKEAEKIMSEMNRRKPFSEEDYRDWPIFRRFRKTKEFRRAFKRIYGKKYVIRLSQKDRTELVKISKKPIINQ